MAAFGSGTRGPAPSSRSDRSAPPVSPRAHSGSSRANDRARDVRRGPMCCFADPCGPSVCGEPVSVRQAHARARAQRRSVFMMLCRSTAAPATMGEALDVPPNWFRGTWSRRGPQIAVVGGRDHAAPAPASSTREPWLERSRRERSVQSSSPARRADHDRARVTDAAIELALCTPHDRDPRPRCRPPR